MPTPSRFGRRLLEARTHRQLTQEELADRAKIPAAVISHFETGVRMNASADNLVKLADALKVTVDYLLGRIDEMAPTRGELERKASGLSADKLDILSDFVDSLARSAKKSPDPRKK